MIRLAIALFLIAAVPARAQVPIQEVTSPGGIEAWLQLGEACGLTRSEITDHRHVQPGVRFAVDAYITFARTKPWVEAVASSLTELFAPDLMAERLAAFEKYYTWIDPAGLQ